MHYDEVRAQFYEYAGELPLIEPRKLIGIRGDELAWSFRVAVDHRLRRAHTAEEVEAMRKAMSR